MLLKSWPQLQVGHPREPLPEFSNCSVCFTTPAACAPGWLIPAQYHSASGSHGCCAIACRLSSLDFWILSCQLKSFRCVWSLLSTSAFQPQHCTTILSGRFCPH